MGEAVVNPQAVSFEASFNALIQRNVDYFVWLNTEMSWLLEDGRSDSPAWQVEAGVAFGFSRVGSFLLAIEIGGNPNLFDQGGGYGGFRARHTVNSRIPIYYELGFRQYLREDQASNNCTFRLGYDYGRSRATSPAIREDD